MCSHPTCRARDQWVRESTPGVVGTLILAVLFAVYWSTF